MKKHLLIQSSKYAGISNIQDTFNLIKVQKDSFLKYQKDSYINNIIVLKNIVNDILQGFSFYV